MNFVKDHLYSTQNSEDLVSALEVVSIPTAKSEFCSPAITTQYSIDSSYQQQETSGTLIEVDSGDSTMHSQNVESAPVISNDLITSGQTIPLDTGSSKTSESGEQEVEIQKIESVLQNMTVGESPLTIVSTVQSSTNANFRSNSSFITPSTTKTNTTTSMAASVPFCPVTHQSTSSSSSQQFVPNQNQESEQQVGVSTSMANETMQVQPVDNHDLDHKSVPHENSSINLENVNEMTEVYVEDDSSEDEPWNCPHPDCKGKEFKNKRSGRVHYREVHVKPKRRCPGCLRIFHARNVIGHFKSCPIMKGRLSRRCPHSLCSYDAHTYEDLCEHISSIHELNLSSEDQAYLDLVNKATDRTGILKRIKYNKKSSSSRDKSISRITAINTKIVAKESIRNTPVRLPQTQPPPTRPYLQPQQLSSIQPPPMSLFQPTANLDLELPNVSSHFESKTHPTNFCHFNFASRIERLPKVCAFPGFEGACAITMKPTIPIVEFPAFIRSWYESKLAEAGAVLVIPPAMYNKKLDNTELDKKLSNITIKSLQKMKIVGKGKSGKSFKVNTCDMNELEMTISKYKDKPYPIRPFENSADEEFKDAFDVLENGDTEYAAHVDGSLFDSDDKHWKLNELANDLNDKRKFYRIQDGKPELLEFNGVRTPLLYVGTWGTWFLLHIEDDNLGSISYNHFGEAKVWYVVPPSFQKKVQDKMALEFETESSICSGFLRHKSHLPLPGLLDEWGVPYSRVEHLPGTYVVLAAGAFHFGYNAGFNVAEAVNYHTFDIYHHFLTLQYKCFCSHEMYSLPREGVVKFYQNYDGHKAFLNNQLKARVPYQEDLGLVLVPNDKMRWDDYNEKHELQRKRNKGHNPFTGKPYSAIMEAVSDDSPESETEDDGDPSYSPELQKKVSFPSKRIVRKRAKPAKKQSCEPAAKSQKSKSDNVQTHQPTKRLKRGTGTTTVSLPLSTHPKQSPAEKSS